MDEVKKLFNRKSQKGRESTESPSPESSSRWRRRSQSRGRTISGQKQSRDLESSPYDAVPQGSIPTHGSDPVQGNAASFARDKNSVNLPSDATQSIAPSSAANSAPINFNPGSSNTAASSPPSYSTSAPGRNDQDVGVAREQNGPIMPQVLDNTSTPQKPGSSSQRSPTLPIAEQVGRQERNVMTLQDTEKSQFSSSAYYDRESNELNRANAPSHSTQTRRRDLPVRSANNDSMAPRMASSTSSATPEKQNHLLGPRGQPGRGAANSDMNSSPQSYDLPSRAAVGSGTSGGDRQLSTGSLANGAIQKGRYLAKPRTASSNTMPSNMSSNTMPSSNMSSSTMPMNNMSSSTVLSNSTRSDNNSSKPMSSNAMQSNPAGTSAGSYSTNGKRYIVEGASQAPSLEGIVDLTNTTRTTVHTTWAKPVIHERIMPKIHHITHPAVERRIHNHQVHHRTLPVIDVQVLPAKHYAPHGPGGSLIEIGSDMLPGRQGQNQHWVVAETVSKLGSDPDGLPGHGGAQNFSARHFATADGAPKSYAGRNGVPTTEQTWVHSPTMHEGARATGQTEPLHFGEPRADGVFHEHPSLQSRRERDAEYVVAAAEARKPMSRTAAADLAHQQKPKQQREREAESALLGARGAGMAAGRA